MSPDIAPSHPLDVRLHPRGLRYRMPSSEARRHIDVHPGFRLTLHDGTSDDANDLPGKPGLSVLVLLAGSTQNPLCGPCGTDCPLARTHRSGSTLLRWAQAEHRPWQAVGSRFQAVELQLSSGFLEGLGALDLLRAADAGHRLCQECGPGVWVGAFPTPDHVAQAAAGLLACDLTSEADELQAARGAVEILSAGLKALRHPPDCCCTTRDRLRLEEARRLLLSDPAKPWCIRGLARRVGLNERKLKSGFRAQFGATVNEYLTSVRLRVAHQKLVEENVSVAEVALMVGYANPSHFALLFRNRYGISPSILLRADHHNVLAATGP